jgi:hypothetical protein
MAFYDTSTAEIDNILLTNSNGTTRIDMKDIFLEMSYYEDITMPTVSATLLLSDASGYLNDFPFVGDESLQLTFKTKGFDYVQGIDVDLRSYKIGQKTRISDRAISYPIEFVSKIAVNDPKTVVASAYEGRVDDIVRRIGQLGGFDLPFAIEATDGLYKYVATQDTVFETINKLRKEAKSLTFPSSAFVFFQNRFTYNFVTLNFLFSQPVRPFRDFYYQYQNNPQNEEIPPNQIISSLEQIKSNDIVDGMRSGLFGNEVLAVDPIRKSTNKTEFDYFGNGFKQTQPHLGTSRVQPTLSSLAQNSQKANRNFVVSDLRDTTPRTYITTNSAQDDIYVRTKHQFLGRRISLAEQANSFAIRISIPGNSDIRVGDVINIYMPDASGFNLNRYDKYLHGKYLVTTARHNVRTDGLYETVLECIKDSFETEVTGTINSASTF